MTVYRAGGSDELPMIIAGAGIAGLTTALTLAASGRRVQLFERAAELTEVGAGLQLSPNATSVLSRLGILDALLPQATMVQHIDLASARTGKTLLSLPASKAAGTEFAPYLAVHRADLQAALLNKARKTSRISLHFGHSFSGAQEIDGGIAVEFLADNKPVHVVCGGLIGADGVWSQVRALVPESSPAMHSGYIALRATVSAAGDIPPALKCAVSEARVIAFLSTGAHLVAYPLRGGSLLNLILIIRGGADNRSYDGEIDLGLMSPVLGRFEPRIAQFLKTIDDWRVWPINSCAPNGAWTHGRIALIGDAAHAMTPFAAQGACMAIEDAAVIANAVSAQVGDVTGALAAYEAKRKLRVARVMARGRFNRFAYHLPQPAALVRNLAFKAGGDRLLDGLSWIYGYDANSA